MSSFPGLTVRVNPDWISELMDIYDSDVKAEVVKSAIAEVIENRKIGKRPSNSSVKSDISVMFHETFMTVDEAMDRLGIKRTTVYDWIKQKKLRRIKPGGGETSKIWIFRESVESHFKTNVEYF